jgi:hypothetical protein
MVLGLTGIITAAAMWLGSVCGPRTAGAGATFGPATEVARIHDSAEKALKDLQISIVHAKPSISIHDQPIIATAIAVR